MKSLSKSGNNLILICYLLLRSVPSTSSCPYIVEDSRDPCEASVDRKCSEKGCCWDETNDTCYKKSCKSGTFGYGCRFTCMCDGRAPCDPVTGACAQGCPAGYWGIGCMLENDCTYNDGYGEMYKGHKTTTESNKTCNSWNDQGAYNDDSFPDSDKLLANNYCRNPDPTDYRTWCYYELGPKPKDRKWNYCSLAACECPDGRWGVNCEEECHCRRAAEYCNQHTGECSSGCGHGWTGSGCQACGNGWFGLNCDLQCNCEDEFEACNKTSGECQSGCLDGYAGEGCLIEIPSMTRAPLKADRSATSITLTWRRWRKPPDKGDGPVTAYYLYYIAEGEIEQQRLKTKEVRAILNNLHNNTLYSVQIAPVHEQGFVGNPSPAVNISTCGVPKQGVRALQITVEQGMSDSSHVTLNVEWEPLDTNDMELFGCEGFLDYNVYVKGPGDDQSRFYNTASIHRISIPDVDPYANFDVAVSIVNNAGFESEKTIKSIIGKSGPVQNMQLSAGTHSITVTWDPPEASNSPIDKYIVRYRQLRVADCETRMGNWNPIIDLQADQTSYVLSSLQPYSQYMVKLWVRTARHKKGQQVSRNITTEATAPSAKIKNLIQRELSDSHISLTWEPPLCNDQNGKTVGFYIRVIHETEEAGDLIEERLVNETNLTMNTKLVPYERYSLSIAYQNHVAIGPEERMGFQMLEAAPPAPSRVHMATSLSDSLTLAWEPPNPPHGEITKYEVKHWTTDNVGSPEHDFLLASDTHFTLQDLKPNNSYTFQVRAFTSVGEGVWSAVTHGFTEETVPSQPLNLRNTSRDKASLTLEWDPPLKANGVLTQYQVICEVIRAQDRFDHANRKQTVRVSASMTTADVESLHAGTEYVCEVRAGTSKGLGDPWRAKFFTLPPVPDSPQEPGYKTSTDTTITLALQPSTFKLEHVESSIIRHRVVVERPEGYNLKARRRRSSAKGKLPCKTRHAELVDYDTAVAQHSRCYITAELEKLDRTQEFVIGDNETYGGYHNVPLEKGIEYYIWFGLYVTVDGITEATYTHITAKIGKAPYSSETQTAGGTAIIAGIIIAIIAAIVIISLIVLVIIRNKRNSQYQPAAGRSDTDHTSSSPKISSHHEKSSTADVYLQSTDSEAEADETDPLNPKPSTPHAPITVENLWNYVRERKTTGSQGFIQEYDEIPLGLTAHCEQARKPENRNKNRYGNIIAYDHSRVKLEPVPNDPHSDYINANFIDAYRRPGAWIATQGPSKATFIDFWRLVWQEHAHRIIMVTNLIEDGRHKCEQYWPDSGTRSYALITIEKLEEEQYADFTIRTFNMTQMDETRIVRQFHFTSWPDHGCPTYATSLIAFRKKVRSYDDPMAGPTVVHCSAGVGRTGTFIALDYLLDMAKAEQQVHVYSCVQTMRTKRVNMVQTQEQYEFVYEALLEALKSGDTAIPCVDFRKRFCDLLKANPETGKVRLAEEFELLSMLSMTPPSQTGCKCALDSENASKNRNTDLIPLDNMQRPFLMTYIPGSSDYINAVFTDGYKQRDAFIITQMPLPQTIQDFWAMIYDHECSAIVMMNELDSTDSTCACYYPVQAGSQQHGPFTIETVALDSTFTDITVRDVTLTINKKASEPRSVRQFQFHGWPSDQKLPVRRSSVIQLLQLIEKWQQRSGNKTIVVHCMDGASRSGLLCAISYMIERLKVEQEVDAFNSVKHTRINRPQLVPSLEQYQYIYDMAEEYMDCFETYANFK